MDAALASLTGLPPALLYAIIVGVAFVENLIPPFPADVTVAFGAFIAAQGEHRLAGVFAAAWVGNVAGALAVYFVSRKYGAERLERQLAGKRAGERDARVRDMLGRWGLPALFAARFIPGVRALVPVVAGTMRLHVPITTVMLTVASAIWYGAIVFVAWRVGADWTAVQAHIAQYSRALGAGALVLVAVLVAAWAIARRRKRAE